MSGGTSSFVTKLNVWIATRVSSSHNSNGSIQKSLQRRQNRVVSWRRESIQFLVHPDPNNPSVLRKRQGKHGGIDLKSPSGELARNWRPTALVPRIRGSGLNLACYHRARTRGELTCHREGKGIYQARGLIGTSQRQVASVKLRKGRIYHLKSTFGKRCSSDIWGKIARI